MTATAARSHADVNQPKVGGGEVLGGLWLLLPSAVVVRGDRLPRRLGWLGIVIGVVGIASVVPPLNDATVAFGLLQIAWFAWLGGVLLATAPTALPDDSSTRVDDPTYS